MKAEKAPTETEKTREQRLRRALARQGYALRKDRHQVPCPGFIIVDPETRGLVFGDNYDLDLDDVERWLKD